MIRPKSAAGTGRRPARRGRKPAINWLVVALALPFWPAALPAQEPDEEESRQIISHAEQQLAEGHRDIGDIERDLNSKLVEREKRVIPLIQKAAEIASFARTLAKRLEPLTGTLSTALTNVANARDDAFSKRRVIEGLLGHSDCQAPVCPISTDEETAYREQLEKLRQCRQAIDKVWSEDQARLRDSIGQAISAAGTVSGMMETIDLQSRVLDPQAPLNEAEAELQAANSPPGRHGGCLCPSLAEYQGQAASRILAIVERAPARA